MSESWSRVCRACLESSRPLRDLLLTAKCQDFAILTGIEVSKLDGLPSWICNECFYYVSKFHKFREKTRMSQNILLNFLKEYQYGTENKDRMSLLNVQRGSINSLSLSKSNTLVLDFINPKPDKSHKSVYSLQRNNATEKNYCRDMVPIANPEKLLTFDHIFNNAPQEDDAISLCEVKLEDMDNDFNHFAFDMGNETSKNSVDVKKEIKSLKRHAKEVGEKKRALDSNELDSNDDHFDFEDDGDSSVEMPKVKKSRKNKESKHKKGKGKKRFRDDKKEINSEIVMKKSQNELLISNSKSETTPEYNSRMVLETEQYKVIKLTREQLLLEMVENSKSEKYLYSPYKCTLCVKGFNYEDVLQNHMTKHEPKNGPFECDLCHQCLPSAVSMRGHKKSHSTKYQCKKCGVIKASRQHLLEHYMLVHEGSPRTYICNVCGKTLTKRTMFQKHMRIHYPSNKIACEKCGKLFKTIETLRAHMLRHADVKRYSCDQCPKAFRYASLLYTHKVTHITTKNFYCVECDMRFKTQSNLRLHLRKSLKHIDPDSLKFGCDQCDKRYDDEKGLRHHVEWVHLGQKNYKCGKCEMQFGSQDGLRSHMKKIHDGIRPARTHICEICNKAFRAKAVLIKHIRVHTGERPYECKECGKKFAQNSTMSTHIKLVHLKMTRHVNKKKCNENNVQEVHNKVPVVEDFAIPMQQCIEPPPTDHTGVPYYFPPSSSNPNIRHVHIPIMKFESDSR